MRLVQIPIHSAETRGTEENDPMGDERLSGKVNDAEITRVSPEVTPRKFSNASSSRRARTSSV